MSFLDKLGETLKGIGWAIGAPVGTAIDVAKAALPGGDPALQGSIKAITTGVEHGTQLFTGGQNGEHENFVSDVTKPATDALDWVYREGISRPLNFLNIEQQRVLADATGTEDNASPMDVGSAWDRASNTHGGYDGKGTSIGREWAYSLEAAKGLEGATLDALGVPDNGPAHGDRFAALTDDGQRALDQAKGVTGKAFDVESGGIDAVARWYLDPTIVGGKALKAARLGKVVAGLGKSTDVSEKLAQQSDGLFAGFGKRHDAAIQFAMAPNRSASELVAAFPGLRESLDGESVASVLAEANKSMRAAGKSDAEIYDQAKLITRASMGDMDALQGIDESVSFAKDALASMQSNKDELQRAADWAVDFADNVTPEMIAEKAKNLDLAGNLQLRGRDYLASDEFLSLTNARIQAVQKDVNAAEQEAARQTRIQNLFGTPTAPNRPFGLGSDRPLLASAIGARTTGLERRAAKEAGTYVGVGRRLGEKALAPVGLDFVFQSTAFNKAIKLGAAVAVPHIYLGVKAHQAFGRMAAPSSINVEDDRAGQALNAWLKHTAVDDESRIQMVSDLMRHQDTNRRGQVIEDAIRKGVESKISAYKKANPYFTDDTEELINTAIRKQAIQDRTRVGAQTMMFSAAKRAEDTEMGKAGSRADLVVGDDGMPRVSPLLPTQLTKIYGMPDLKGVDHILSKHSNWITDMSAWARGDRAPDPTRIQTIGERVFGNAGQKHPKLAHAIANQDVDETGQLKLNSVNDFAWKSEEVAKMVLDSFNKIWKTATLATRPVAYAMRVNVDSGMRFAAATGMSSWMMHSTPRWVGFATLGGASRAKAAIRSAQDDRRLLMLKSGMETAEDAHNAERLERARALDTEIANFENNWRSKNGDVPIESIDEFIAHERHPEPGVKHMVDGGAQPKLMRISGKDSADIGVDENGNLTPVGAKEYAQAKANGGVESDLEHVYRVVSEADYKRMKASGYLDTEGAANQPGVYKDGADVAQDGMFAMAHVDRQLLNEYGRRNEPSVVMKIAVKRGDGWRRDTLDRDPENFPLPALSTAKRLPFSRVQAVSPRFSGGSNKWIFEENGIPEVIEHDSPGVHADLMKRKAALDKGGISDPGYAEMKAEHDAIQARLNQYTTGGRAGRRAAYGAFGEPGRKSIQTRAGEIEGAFSGQAGIQNRWLESSQMTAALMGDGQKLALKDAQIGNWTYVLNTDPNHMDAWMRAVNQQLMQTEVGRQAVKAMIETRDPQKASAQLARWATGTPEGKKLMGEMVWHAADKQAYTNELIGYVNHYLPSHDLRMQAATNGRIEKSELERTIPNVEDRPPVHGESLANAINRGNPLGKMVNNSVSRILKWAGEGTEDQLARHPMYAAVYEQEAKRRAEFLMADPRIEKIGLEQIKTLIQDQAHAKARESLKKYMFDIAATSDLSHFMRFTSPFVAAWEDTIRKWGRIAKENPELIGKFAQAWNAPNAMGLVVDQNGHHVDHDGIFGYKDPVTGEHLNTYLVIPRGLTKWIPGAGDSQLKINKQSLNIVLQGGLQPGFGPLVAYPVGKLQEAAPQLDGVAKFINPYGPPSSVWDAVAPTTVKAITDAVNDQSYNHAQDTKRIWGQMLAEYRLDPEKFGGKQPTIEEASKRAGSLGLLKIVNRVIGVPFPGFPATFESPYQLYIDSYHSLKDQERDPRQNHPYGWADDKFIEMYGDTFFPLVQSSSLNNSGLSASAEAVDAAKGPYKGLIAKYGVENGQPNSTLTRLIVGQEGEGAYNDSAHLWQMQHEISPASGVMYRSTDNPQAAQAAADAKLGWLKWRQKTSELDGRAIQDGMKTFRDDPALVDEYNQFKQSLAQENNAWYVDWSQQDNTKFTRDLKSLGEVADSGKFGPMRTDMVGVKQYLALRQAFEDETTQYGISPTSKDAQPFRQEFTDAVSDLVSSNSQFAEWSYYTFLDRDPYLEPVTTTGASTTQQAAPTDWGIQ